MDSLRLEFQEPPALILGGLGPPPRLEVGGHHPPLSGPGSALSEIPTSPNSSNNLGGFAQEHEAWRARKTCAWNSTSSSAPPSAVRATNFPRQPTGSGGSSGIAQTESLAGAREQT